MKKAIYLSGGGARGAYQAGVLKGIQGIINKKRLPAEILSSVSAGSINASYLAMHAENFSSGINGLIDLWSDLSCDKIFSVNNYSLFQSILRNFASMIFHYQPKKGGYLLDTTPLKNLLNTHLDFKKINDNITRGLLEFDVAATCYDTIETTSFIASSHKVSHWKKIRNRSELTEITCNHILASSSVPLFFPSVKINGLHYGDGGLRAASPLRAAIRLGAEKILVIGTRAHPQTTVGTKNAKVITEVSFAKMLGNILNSLFLDSLDRDLELSKKINDTLSLLSNHKLEQSHWRKIDILCIRPTIDIGQLAVDKQYALPFFLKYLMGAFGSKSQSGDFISFLLFESEFCKTLVDIGYQDALNAKDSIIEFFSDSDH